MERQKKIVDASIIVKWFSKEDQSVEAVELRDRHINGEVELVVPELVFMETLNALRYKKLKPKILDKINKDLWNVQLEVVGLSDYLLSKAIEFSIRNDLSIYDAVYVALSQVYEAEFITADKKLLELPNSISLDRF